ncbi:MAG: serine/threonine protein kinase [Deltaproteobacteria bacterium]|nr:serine/threonine protein kinase [Deltaproteobacteria bacterium]
MVDGAKEKAEASRTPPAGIPGSIGRYEVDRLLGQGGMGRVWLARDTVLGRNVAIKTLRDDLALPPSVRDELLTRMQHEARAAAAVSHPNIVTLHDMGEDDHVGLFLVFEYVSGPRNDGPESLRDRLREGPLALPEVAKLARELGSALTFAHGAGVIHRDIKPENILFSRTGAKIADFGIARIPESTITRANTVLGTPAYTAPEALSKGDFGPASDQFALAATLYEAATGRRAFGSDDPIVTAGKVSSEPPPPLEVGLGTATQVRTLTAALSKGLAKEVAGRFGSCLDLGDAVARAIERGDAPSLEMLAAREGDGERIEVERTPLSSRVALTERAVRSAVERASLTPYGETPARPSVMIRKKTHRVQNLIAAAALLVIIGLVVMGRRSDEERARFAVPSASASSSALAPNGLAIAASGSAVVHKPRPHAPEPRASAAPKPSAAPSADASAPPATTATASSSATPAE